MATKTLPSGWIPVQGRQYAHQPIRHHFRASATESNCKKVVRPVNFSIEAVKDDDAYNCAACARLKAKTP